MVGITKNYLTTRPLDQNPLINIGSCGKRTPPGMLIVNYSLLIPPPVFDHNVLP